MTVDEAGINAAAARRFEGGQAPAEYGYGVACIPFDPAMSYRRLLARAVIAGLRARWAAHRSTS